MQVEESKKGSEDQTTKYSGVTWGQIFIFTTQLCNLEYLALYSFTVRTVLISDNLFSEY